ncbi:MAG TPA: helix-hairpin-helix domain-containing protein, partial [Candidatus Deferrimicrobium sp.]|nr:helix-hairpin-helix domain-containing protein [Candidatus Deferrimicrobium sp.]
LTSIGFTEQPVLALAKRLDEVFLPGIPDAIVMHRGSPALLLLKRLRDEAHRFAISYNRKVRTKRTVKSALDDVPGVGPARRDLLLKTFGSVDRIRRLSAQELAAVRGVNVKLAETILSVLNA